MVGGHFDRVGRHGASEPYRCHREDRVFRKVLSAHVGDLLVQVQPVQDGVDIDQNEQLTHGWSERRSFALSSEDACGAAGLGE